MLSLPRVLYKYLMTSLHLDARFEIQMRTSNVREFVIEWLCLEDVVSFLGWKFYKEYYEIDHERIMSLGGIARMAAPALQGEDSCPSCCFFHFKSRKEGDEMRARSKRTPGRGRKVFVS